MVSQLLNDRNRTTSFIIGSLIAIHVAFGLHTASRKTITHDEIWHLPIGILNLQSRDFHFDDLNPPLTRMWAGLPGWLIGPEVESGKGSSDVAGKYIRHHPGHRTWYVCGRAFNLMLSVATILIACRWAYEWFGMSAALMTALLGCTEPNVLAHSSLVTPDAGLMLGFTATLYVLCRWWSQPTWKLAILTGIITGLTQGTKFTAILLYAVVVVVGVLAILRPRIADVSRRKILLQWLTILLFSLIAWNATYLFRGSGRSLASYSFQSQSMRTIQGVLKPVEQFPVPLPESYMTGIDRQKSIMEQQHPVYLDGQWSLHGFRSYFPRTLQYKLSHVLQLLVLVGVVLLLFRRHRASRIDMLVLLGLPCALLLGIASLSSMQLGVRYVLPLMPLLILIASSVACSVTERSPLIKWGLTSIVVVAAFLPLRHHPDHLAYFNEAAGGRIGGRYHLLDSNLDWGQDLHMVREFMTTNGLDEIGLVYFGTLPPDILGIDYHVSPGRSPAPGWHAVSVNFVMGRPHVVIEPDGTGRPTDINEFGYFRGFEPVTTLGGSIDIYHIESR
ncbi:MAG: phospholipid carrier-dependent glycosyltransferase [Planctomycetaceae bacterium]|nr:phospholipid carrier-dependent glycosyltransferase [Planctomycetaceae bacterium]